MKNHKKKLNNQGSLLVGVIVSLGIILTMSLISFPYLRRFQPNLKLSGVTRDLSGDLRYAQQLTITEQVVYGVELDTINNQYNVLKLDGATTTIKTVSLPPEVEFDSVSGFTGNIVRFNSYGAVSQSGEIKLINSNNIIKAIQVKPSGYVDLID